MNSPLQPYDRIDRVISGVTPRGLPDVAEWNKAALRQYRFRSLRMPDDHMSIGLIGDSWTQNQPRMARPLSRFLKGLYGGDAGAGYCGAGNFTDDSQAGVADDAEIGAIVRKGWTRVASAPTCGILGDHLVAASVEDTLTWDRLVEQDTLRVHFWRQPSGGTFKIRERSESWITHSTDGTVGYATADFALSGTGGLTLGIDSLAAGVIVSGVDFAKTGNGVVLHKLGFSGGTVGRFTDMTDAVAWQTGIGLLNLDVAAICLATNDVFIANGGAAVFEKKLITLGHRIKAITPLCDLWFIFPCDSIRTGADFTPYREMRDAMMAAAITLDAAFLDLGKYYGPLSEYQYSEDDSTRNLVGVDGFHPVTSGPNTGYLASILNQFLKL